jgi:hypothetical protein
MPDVPFDPAELGRRARAIIEPQLQAVEKSFEGFDDSQAAARPAPEQWSALEVVAHLIHGERENQDFIADLVQGLERVGDGGGGNVDAQVRATLSVYPTISEMLGEFRRSFEETIRLAELVPPEFVANRGSFYRVGQLLLQADLHINDHLAQLQAALAAAKG